MGLKKKVIWNHGKTPERSTQRNIPPYVAEPEISDAALRDSWNHIYVGHICFATTNLFAMITPPKYSIENYFPFPVLYAGDGGGWNGDLEVKEGQILIYLGNTYVNCVGSKNRIISKPYKTVFFNGLKFLISDPNSVKPFIEVT